MEVDIQDNAEEWNETPTL